MDQNIVMSLNRRVGDACKQIMDEKMRGLNCKNVEIYGIWGFISWLIQFHSNRAERILVAASTLAD